MPILRACAPANPVVVLAGELATLLPIFLWPLLPLPLCVAGKVDRARPGAVARSQPAAGTSRADPSRGRRARRHGRRLCVVLAALARAARRAHPHGGRPPALLHRLPPPRPHSDPAQGRE